MDLVGESLGAIDNALFWEKNRFCRGEACEVFRDEEGGRVEGLIRPEERIIGDSSRGECAAVPALRF